VLCRDIYHCLPVDLDAQDWQRIETHLICLDVEAKVRAQKKPSAKGGK
jgi:hypothetical protein